MPISEAGETPASTPAGFAQPLRLSRPPSPLLTPCTPCMSCPPCARAADAAFLSHPPALMGRLFTFPAADSFPASLRILFIRPAGLFAKGKNSHRPLCARGGAPKAAKPPCPAGGAVCPLLPRFQRPFRRIRLPARCPFLSHISLFLRAAARPCLFSSLPLHTFSKSCMLDNRKKQKRSAPHETNHAGNPV